MSKRKPCGFTFVEITIVAAIIAILAAIAVPNFLEAQTRAMVSSTKSQMVNIKQALEKYHTDFNAYPPNDPSEAFRGAALFRLSTPIGYIGYVPRDLFWTTYNAQNEKRLPYGYFNAEPIAPETGLELVKPYDEGMEGWVSGIIWGYAPANGFDNAYTSVSAETARADILPYDTTNGTLSDGDIHIRFP